MVAKKDEKTSLGSKILNYVPWRIALTAAAFAIPIAGPIVGTVVGALAYGNYRQNNRTENPASKFDNGPDIAFLIIVRTGHRKAESTARRKDSNRGMFFLALFFIANQ